MGFIIDLFYHPPPMPPIHLPLPARMVPGVMGAISAAFKLAYDRGLLDGFLLGAVVTLILDRRAKIVKGISDATDYL